MSMKKRLVKSITDGNSTKTSNYFNECREDGFAIISSKLIQSGKMAEIGGALSTLLALIDSANTKTYQCNPSIEKLSQMTGKSERNVRRDIDKLVELHMIEKYEAPLSKGKHIHTNNYVITVHEALANIEMPERVEHKEAVEEKVETKIEEVKTEPKKVPNPFIAYVKQQEQNSGNESKKEINTDNKVNMINVVLKKAKAEIKKNNESKAAVGQKALMIENYYNDLLMCNEKYKTDPKLEEITLTKAARLAYELNILSEVDGLDKYAYEEVSVLDMKTFKSKWVKKSIITGEVIA